MLQVIPKWKITYQYNDGRTINIWMADRFRENIMRRASEVNFSPSGLEEPESVTIVPAYGA